MKPAARPRNICEFCGQAYVVDSLARDCEDRLCAPPEPYVEEDQMTPVKRSWFKDWADLWISVALYLTFFVIFTPGIWAVLAGSTVIGVAVQYLWCARTISGRYCKAWRSMEAGDPRSIQLWRWMDILGPTASQGAEELYLRRLYIVRTPWFGVMLHWIKREDWDRDALHDHPWEFWRFIVSGGYTEEIALPPRSWRNLGGKIEAVLDVPLNQVTVLAPSDLVTHRRWRASKFPSGAYHRISSVKPRTVSFVINGPKTNSWGFFVPGTGKIYWRDYVEGAR